jgi:hypothetical protein
VPISLSTLFTSPQDVWDALSTEGVDLRVDDHGIASGQIINTTSDTPIGSTSMAVAALPVALLAGAQLEFDEAGMPNPVQIQLTAAAALGATSLSIQQVTNSGSTIVLSNTVTDIPANAQARDSGVNAATGARLLVGCRKGTSKVKLFCNCRYDDVQLKLCGTVLDWATICAAKWLATRRAQGCPNSLREDYDEAIELMKMVQVGQLAIEDCSTRGADWPSMSNVTVNPGYDGMRTRVESNISEQTPTSYSQYIDWNSAVILDF